MSWLSAASARKDRGLSRRFRVAGFASFAMIASLTSTTIIRRSVERVSVGEGSKPGAQADAQPGAPARFASPSIRRNVLRSLASSTARTSSNRGPGISLDGFRGSRWCGWAAIV